MLKKFSTGILFPLALAGFMAWICQPLYLAHGKCDVFMLLLLMGLPFGIGKMFIWFIPRGCGIGGSVGMFVLNILIGGMIGFFLLAATIVINVISFSLSLIRRFVK